MATWRIFPPGEDGIVRYELEGDLLFESMLDLAQEVYQFSRESGCKVFLGDFQESIPRLSPFEMYNIAHTLEDLGLPKSIRVAGVVAKEIFDDLSFLETVCHNRGYSFSVFRDEESARRWLTFDSMPSPLSY